MATIMEFMVKSTVTSGVLLCFYWLFLRNRNLHSYNRFYLLGTVVISLIVPFLHFEWYSVNAATNATAIKLLNVISSGEGEKEIIIKQASSISVYGIMQVIYAAVSLIFLGVLVARIVWVYRLKEQSIVTCKEGYKLAKTDNSKAPFSFFNVLFWKDGIDIDTETGKQVLAHELVHIRQYHTLDKLFIQLVLVCVWINPFYWLIQKELSMVHEFVADEVAIADRDSESFAVMLLQSHYGNIFPDIVHPFFYSPIKRRLIMLNQTNKTSYALLRRLIVLPLLAGVVLLFSFSKKDVDRADKKIVLVLDAGHGGQDNGAVSKNGILEKDLALTVTDRISKLAGDYNIEVVKTRPDDKYVVISERAKVPKQHAADLLVSIHINSGVDTVTGYEVYLGTKSSRLDDSKVLAANIVSQLNTNKIFPKVSERSLWVLNYSEVPSVLIECGSIDNSQDMAILKNDRQLDGFCRNILAGVVDYENSVRK